jgi:prolyl 4-hydroxylase
LLRINRRIAALTAWPMEYGEPLQILHYGIGAEYQPHYDYFDPSDPGTSKLTAQGGQRVATLIIYLNDPQRGGATLFPDLGIEIAAVKGNAVFFSYERPHPDTRTLHAGTPVLEGEKWIATRWLRERAYR